jgi:hypothetical protein
MVHFNKIKEKIIYMTMYTKISAVPILKLYSHMLFLDALWCSSTESSVSFMTDSSYMFKSLIHKFE